AGGGGARGRGGARGGGGGGPLAPTGAAAAVTRLVGCDRDQPRTERRVSAEAAERPPGLDECVLGGILGVGCVAHDQIGNSEHDVSVRLDQLLERAHVAALRSQHELLLGAWTALHSGDYTATPAEVPDLPRHPPPPQSEADE